MPLSEWVVLYCSKGRKLISLSRSCNAILEVWRRISKRLIPGQSIIASIFCHPEIQNAWQNLDFGELIQGDLYQYYMLVKTGEVLSEQEVVQKLGSCPVISFQYVQIRFFLRKQRERMDIFRHPPPPPNCI